MGKHRKHLRADHKDKDRKIDPQQECDKCPVGAEKGRISAQRKDEIFETVFSQVPEKCAGDSGYQKEFFVPHRRQKVVEKIKEDKGNQHIEKRKEVDDGRLRYNTSQGLDEFGLEYDGGDKAKEKERLKHGKK
jgi:hypothetical protein